MTDLGTLALGKRDVRYGQALHQSVAVVGFIRRIIVEQLRHEDAQGLAGSTRFDADVCWNLVRIRGDICNPDAQGHVGLAVRLQFTEDGLLEDLDRLCAHDALVADHE